MQQERPSDLTSFVTYTGFRVRTAELCAAVKHIKQTREPSVLVATATRLLANRPMAIENGAPAIDATGFSATFAPSKR